MKRIMLFAVVLIISLTESKVVAQSNYSLDQFKSYKDYYTAFNNGNGSAIVQTNTSDFVAGNSSIKITYNFNAGSNYFFSSMRNYGTQTQDWSLPVTSISLRVKGGNSSTYIKIRLWEDIGRDGQFNGLDEVFSSPAQVIDTNGFTVLNFDLANFVKVTGNGNRTLDINRIRAWDIAVENISSNTQSGSLYYDELSLNSNYSTPTSGSSKISGSFIQLWNTVGCRCGQFNLQQWRDELQKMKDACMSKVFIQYGVYGNLSWYSPSNVAGVITNYNTLNLIFQAAEELGMKVHTGLYFDETWNAADKNDNNTYTSLAAKQKNVIDEIWDLFGTSAAFGGWYIPQEINDLEFNEYYSKNFFFGHLQEVASYAKSKRSTLPVSIAPFFNLWLPSDELALWYEELFTTAPDIDRVYFQDGVGITLKDPDFHLPIYYDKLQTVCANNNVQFNVTAESFQQLTGWPIDGGSFTANPATFDRFQKQLWVAEKHQANDIIQFSWQYMQPENSSLSDSLYNNYKSYSCNLTSNVNNSTENFKVFPNPAQNVVTFSSVADVINLYSQDGKLVFSDVNVKQIDISKLIPGHYILTGTAKKGKFYKSIFITH